MYKCIPIFKNIYIYIHICYMQICVSICSNMFTYHYSGKSVFKVCYYFYFILNILFVKYTSIPKIRYTSQNASYKIMNIYLYTNLFKLYSCTLIYVYKHQGINLDSRINYSKLQSYQNAT